MNTVGRDDFAGSTKVSTSFLNRSDESPLGEDVHQATAASPLSGEALQRHRAYWQRKLAGAPSLLQWLTDRSRPAQQSYVGEQVSVRIEPALTQRLQQLSLRHDLTVQMPTRAAWSIGLSCLSGQHDAVIGTSTDNLKRAEHEQQDGCFVNTQSLRVQVAGTLAQILRADRENAWAARAHQNRTFGQLLALIDRPRNPVHAPILLVMLRERYHEEEAVEFAIPLTSANQSIDGIVKFDLKLHLNEAQDHIVGESKYAAALFGRATIARHINYLRRVLEAVVDNGTQTVAAIEMLDIVEQPPLRLGGSAMQRVAQIWAEVSKLERVGRQDNFFELRGHPLLAVTMIKRMRRTNLLANVRSLFITPTLAAMAA